MSATFVDVSGAARRRQAVWRGGVWLRSAGVLFLPMLPHGLWRGSEIGPSSGTLVVAELAGVWLVVAGLAFVLARRLSRGNVRAARAAVAVTVVFAVLHPLVTARFAGLVGPVTILTAALVIVSAWTARWLAEAARAVLGRPLRRLDAVVLDVVAPALAAASLVVTAAAAVVQVQALGGDGRALATAEWALLALAAAGYAEVRIVVEALRDRRRCAVDGADDARPPDALWAAPGRGARFLQQSRLGLAVQIAFLLVSVPWPLLTLVYAAGADTGPIVLPVVLLQAVLAWRFANLGLRISGRMQLAMRGQPTPWSPTARTPDVLYLRSFLVDRWRIRAAGIRYPSGSFGRPRLEEVLLRRLWAYGTVMAAENLSAFAPFTGPIGATKRALSAESWHVTLAQWMRDARLVVAIGGPTGGLLWELQQLQQLGLQNRLLLVVPPVDSRWWGRRGQGRREVARSWAAVQGVVGQVPGMSVPASIDLRRTRVVVPGTEDEDACLVVSDGDHDFDYEAAVEAAVTVCLNRQRASPTGGPVGSGSAVPLPPSSADDETWQDLPEHVRRNLSDPLPGPRHRSILELYYLAADQRPAVAAAAVHGLGRLASDGNEWVMTEARRALAVLGVRPPPPPPFAVNPPPAPRGELRRARLESPLWLWLSGLLIGGPLMVGLFVFAVVDSAEVQLPRVAVPGQRELVLDDPGRYTVYYEAAGATDESAALPPVTVSLLPRGGAAEVAVHPYDHFSSYSFGEYSGRAIATAEITAPGRYLVRTTGRSAPPGSNVFLLTHEQSALAWLLVVALLASPVAFFTGVSLFIVALMVRSRAGEARPSADRPPPTAGRGAVAGWYVDPEGRYELRYWDGRTWTVHVFRDGVQALDLVQPLPGAPTGE